MPKTFTLSKPIKIVGKSGIEERKTIELRDPTADDMFDLSMPAHIIRHENENTKQVSIEMVMDGPSLKKWVEKLSGLMAAEMGQMAARDVQAMFLWLSGELNPAGDSKNSD